MRLTEEQKRMFCEMLYKAFLEIRNLAGVGLSDQAAALADAFHNLPLFLLDPDFNWERVRTHVKSYQQKFPRRVVNDVVSGSYYDYVAMLNAIEYLES